MIGSKIEFELWNSKSLGHKLEPQARPEFGASAIERRQKIGYFEDDEINQGEHEQNESASRDILTPCRWVSNISDFLYAIIDE